MANRGGGPGWRIVIMFGLAIFFLIIYFNSDNVIYFVGQEDPFEKDILTRMSPDDPRLLSIIRNWFLEYPSKSDPYKFATNPPDTKGQIGVPAVVDDILHQKRNGFYIECGAFDGESLSNSLFFELERDWSGILIEADYLSYNILKQKNRKAFSINACLTGSGHPERLDFKGAGVFGGLANLNLTSPALIGFQETYYTGTSRTSCFPLYSILLALGNPVVDYFSLDIEGAEWTIVRSMPWDKVDIRVISLENFHLGDENELLEKHMEKNGYMILKKVEFDTIFVKK